MKSPLHPGWNPDPTRFKSVSDWISRREPFLVRYAPFLVLALVVVLAIWLAGARHPISSDFECHVQSADQGAEGTTVHLTCTGPVVKLAGADGSASLRFKGTNERHTGVVQPSTIETLGGGGFALQFRVPGQLDPPAGTPTTLSVQGSGESYLRILFSAPPDTGKRNFF